LTKYLLNYWSTSLSTSNQKWKSKSQRSGNKEQMRQKIYKTSLNEESSKTKCAFGIGPPAWIKKEMNDSTIERQFVSTIISLLTSYKLNKFVPGFSIFMNWNFARILHLRGSRYFHLMPSLPIICIYLHAVTGGNKSICYSTYSDDI